MASDEPPGHLVEGARERVVELVGALRTDLRVLSRTAALTDKQRDLLHGAMAKTNWLEDAGRLDQATWLTEFARQFAARYPVEIIEEAAKVRRDPTTAAYWHDRYLSKRSEVHVQQRVINRLLKQLQGNLADQVEPAEEDG